MWPFPYQKYRSTRILTHILFWLAYLFFNALNLKKFYPDVTVIDLMTRIGVTIPVDICATYLTAFVLLPRFLNQRRFTLFILTLIPSAIVFILLQRLLLYYITYPLFYPSAQLASFWQFNWLYAFTNIYVVVFAVSLIKLWQTTMRQQQQAQNLDKERIEAELKFLKAQVHPHFLFNTLNNLYALALDKSDKTAEVVLKLSELLNYILYECNEPSMLISKEIKLIENYIELERLRYGRQLSVNLNIEGDVTGKKIAPMLLLPFVENAFKHGVSKVSKEAYVEITLNVEVDRMVFEVLNSRSTSAEKDVSGYTEGIGLKNVSRRLALLYPGRHLLELHESGREFQMRLEIKI